MNLGNTIKTIRSKRGIRQNELAENCKLSQTYLSQIENNQKEPNISTLKQICSSLDVPLPIVFFMALDDEDVQENKKEAFKLIAPAINNFISEFFISTQVS